MPMTERARARVRECEWQTALDGVHAGNRALAARIVAGAVRPARDVRALAARWLQGGGYGVWPAQPPFVWEGQHGDRKVLVSAVLDEGLAAVEMFLALRLSERVTALARSGAGIVLLGFSARVAGRCTVERWITADEFGGGIGDNVC
jgi:hypothetical protein